MESVFYSAVFISVYPGKRRRIVKHFVNALRRAEQGGLDFIRWRVVAGAEAEGNPAEALMRKVYDLGRGCLTVRDMYELIIDSAYGSIKKAHARHRSRKAVDLYIIIRDKGLGGEQGHAGKNV